MLHVSTSVPVIPYSSIVGLVFSPPSSLCSRTFESSLFTSRKKSVGISNNRFELSSSSNAREEKVMEEEEEKEEDGIMLQNIKNKNTAYITGLLENLEVALDEWILRGAHATRVRAYNILVQIQTTSMNRKFIEQAERMTTRASMPLEAPPLLSPEERWQQTKSEKVKMGNADIEKRKEEAKKRREWEAKFQSQRDGNPRSGGFDGSTSSTGSGVSNNIGSRNRQGVARSALTSRTSSLSQKTDAFMYDVNNIAESSKDPAMKTEKAAYTGDRKKTADNLMNAMDDAFVTSRVAEDKADRENVKEMYSYMNELDEILPETVRVIRDKEDLEETFRRNIENSKDNKDAKESSLPLPKPPEDGITNTEEAVEALKTASANSRTSELIARAGAGSSFTGNELGIGGLDDVLSQIKRRVWVPLAAPPALLSDLGIKPVRGLLLYGEPGCGKTLLARCLGAILSPARPITIVSGPEIMDKFVGASEANLRAVFDHPPNVYPHFQQPGHEEDDQSPIAKSALHVIVLDEFDAMARSRGGRGGSGEQGDAGVARDSVVNQMLAKMDGVDELCVPTLVIGLTNKRSLIEPALLRPGRFEVQIEVPRPRTVEQRVSILKVHTNHMYQKGRVLVADPPARTVASRRLEKKGKAGIPTYEELLNQLATECDGMSGASLAGVCRAAASHALERAVYDFAGSMAAEDEQKRQSTEQKEEGTSVADCLVTTDDFELAIHDVRESSGSSDGGENKEEEEVDDSGRDDNGDDDDIDMA
eukprot:CAMPEP_0195507934 /NCGR_PEP_ID=MMETSP0794_2-20130614/1273_1 /TAXON_ID=515487 /ORGANISM="Stephanopyxis turris, Strain CCMP 815" /LENGTH=761 /DNA_ID=CAMNT_0040634769 /DNA_START=391 /DNA_END=2676 /DNA_ORIENTATION=+